MTAKCLCCLRVYIAGSSQRSRPRANKPVVFSEMTYNVSMGTLNPTIPYHTVLRQVAAQLQRMRLCQLTEDDHVWVWVWVCLMGIPDLAVFASTA